MPELVPVLERLAAAVGEPGAATVLTQVAFKPFFVSCSQGAVAGALVRNYDFDPEMCERTIARTKYLRPVIGMNEGLWGMLDGMNEAGLAVSLTFGGRFVYGPGCASRWSCAICWRPAARWPGSRPWDQSFAAFQPGTKTVTLGMLEPRPACQAGLNPRDDWSWPR